MRDRLRHLSKGVAIYGAGDAAISIVSLLLLPVYIKYDYLVAADYGALAVIVALETFLKVVFRWGLDGAFMRFYYQREDGPPRERLASTIVLFMLAANGLLLLVAFIASTPVAARLFDDARYLTALRLMLVNTFLISFTFLPFHLMRMRDEAAAYSAFAFARSAGTLVLRVVLVIGLGFGVTGIYAADLAVTVVLLPLLWPWTRRLIRLAFSTSELRVALRFGLPRLPHGLAVQALDGGNKLLFGRYVTDVQLGVYNIAVTLGQGIKFFLSAFETAWAPFYYATAEQPDAKDVFGKMTTYSIAVLTLLVAGTTAIAHDAILVMAKPSFLDGARVIPLIALGMAFQGVYLLTSIGLNLTGRTEFYPVSTISAAVVGLASGAWLMPRYGPVGAAVAFFLSYLTQASVAFMCARRLYRIPYEGLRLARVVAAGIVAAGAGVWLVPPVSPLLGVLLRGTVTVAVYLALLWLSGFLRPTERAFLREIVGRLRQKNDAD